jgi:hypothetical protein
MTAHHHGITMTRPLAASRWWALASLVLALLWLGGLGSALGLVGGWMHRRANPDLTSTARRIATAAVVIGAVGLAATVLAFMLLSGSSSRPSG